MLATVAIALLGALLAAACTTSSGNPGTAQPWPRSSSTTTTSPVEPAPAEISWRYCGSGECGVMTVPLTQEPDSKTIELALYRVPATDPAARIGSLLVNPGGPGASGVDLARAAPSFLPDALLERFDIVGWDPRGTGASAPVACGDELDYLFSGDTAPENGAEWAQLDEVSRRFATDCGDGSGPELLANIATVDTVTDMERIRQALGEEEISFLGYSYGTELGAVYATRYPDRVRAMVLDGAVDPALSAAEVVIQQSEALEHGFDEFAADCASDRSCPIRDDPSGVYAEVSAAIEAAPLVVSTRAGDRLVTPAVADIAVAATLYSQSSWGDLAGALARAADGDGAGLLDEFDAYVERSPDGRYGVAWAAFLAISCVDGPTLGPPDAYPGVEAEAAARAPRFGATNVGLGLSCAYWPVTPGPGLPPVSAPDAAPIVVIGTTNDPVTPPQWSEALAGRLGGEAQLVVFDGQGHTSFPAGIACLDDRVVDYLVDLTVPPGRPC